MNQLQKERTLCFNVIKNTFGLNSIRDLMIQSSRRIREKLAEDQIKTKAILINKWNLLRRIVQLKRNY